MAGAVSIKTRVASALLAITPILYIYRVGPLPINWGDLACIYVVLLSLIDIFSRKARIKKCPFLIYFFFSFPVSLFMVIVHGRFDLADFATKWVRIIIYYIVIDISIYKRINYHTFVKWNIGFGVIASIVLLIQEVVHVLFSRDVFFYIDSYLFPLNYGDFTINGLIRLKAQYPWRPCSIFIEPSHFAEFALLPFSILLFSDDRLYSPKRRIVYITVLTAAILLSRSANGFFIMSLLWGLWYLRHISHRMNVTKMLLLFFGGAVAMWFIFSSSYLDDAVQRLNSVTATGATTGTQRLLQGFAVFSQYPLPLKLFGSGYGNFGAFIIGNNVLTSYVTVLGNEFMNNFSLVLVSSGICGFVFYLVIWFGIYFDNTEITSRAAFLIITILFCTTGTFYSSTPAMYLGYVRCPKTVVDKKI